MKRALVKSAREWESEWKRYEREIGVVKDSSRGGEESDDDGCWSL